MATGQFCESYPPIMDGVALTVRTYTAELNRTLGPRYAVIPAIPKCRARPRTGVLQYFFVPLASRPPYRLGLPKKDLSSAQELRRLRFDLVHAHSSFSVGRLALRLARHQGIPIVATFLSKYRDNFTSALPFTLAVDWAVRRIIDFYDSVDQVWVPSGAALETLRQYGYRGAAEVVRNGVDLLPPIQVEGAPCTRGRSGASGQQQPRVVIARAGVRLGSKGSRVVRQTAPAQKILLLLINSVMFTFMTVRRSNENCNGKGGTCELQTPR